MSNWLTITESKFAWEREALDFVRLHFPNRDPYRAWANFEFIADDGSINEVDLLVFTPKGFFLVEIKSRPGRLTGDAGTWTWDNEGRRFTDDNPLQLANVKAKKLRSLLERQKACQKKGPVPFIEPLVFCSAEGLQCELQGNGRLRVCLRDRTSGTTHSEPRPSGSGAASGIGILPVGHPADVNAGSSLASHTNDRLEAYPTGGILAAIFQRDCPGLEPEPRSKHDKPIGKMLAHALEQAGIRPSQRHRKVNDYVLGELINNGPGFQDWKASHVQVAESVRRVRLYLIRSGATIEERQRIDRAALREFKLLENLQHPGVLRCLNYTEHEVGAALLFEHDANSMRLDHFLAQRNEQLSITTRLDLLRQIAEVMRFAHGKRVLHRALSPQSILVTEIDSDRPRVKIFNWQTGSRSSSSSVSVSQGVSATSHLELLVDDLSTGYMAPEAVNDDSPGEHLDVFSLGAIAYHVFSGVAPAVNRVELTNKLRESRGLSVSSVMNGAGEWLQMLIQQATHPIVANRTDSVTEFLSMLDDVEELEFTAPDDSQVDDPERAQTGDLLPGGFQVKRRIGQGACSVVFLVERDGELFVLKVANSVEHNQRIKDEAEVVQRLHHAHIVQFAGAARVADRDAFLLRPVFSDKEKQQIETLAHRIKREGRLHVDLLQRFGENLLEIIKYLEDEVGISHRDIKPDNIAVGMAKSGDKLHLMLFDFSLSRASVDNIRAGTQGYLDPFLPLRNPPRWDLHAERFAVAVTLYEMATGTLPKWGDGKTEPSQLPADVDVTLDAELLDADLREPLLAFFRKALKRQPDARFDSAETMCDEWRRCFDNIAEPGALSDQLDATSQLAIWQAATFETSILDLGLGTRATNALDRANIVDVASLLRANPAHLWRMRGVGKKTCREMLDCQSFLKKQLGAPPKEVDPAKPTKSRDRKGAEILDSSGSDSGTEDRFLTGAASDVAQLGIDRIVARLMSPALNTDEETALVIKTLLGLNESPLDQWPSQTDVARHLRLTAVAVHQKLKQAVARWSKDTALQAFRRDLVELVQSEGGLCVLSELPSQILASRGSAELEPMRTTQAFTVLRAAVEVERCAEAPRLVVRRDRQRVLVAVDDDLIPLAAKLGNAADKLAEEDPLATTSRVAEVLHPIVANTALQAVSDNRLMRLAATASTSAALSTRNEFYPRGMSALRALKLSKNTILSLRQMTLVAIQDRVSDRYPVAATLPNRPELDALLREAGIDVIWNPLGASGDGCYITKQSVDVSSTTGSVLSRQTTNSHPDTSRDLSPEEADARQFEDKLHRAIREGSFLSLLIEPRAFASAQQELLRRFPLELVDVEGMLLDSLQAEAAKAKVSWDLILETDAEPNQGDWNKLLLLVKRAMPQVEQQLRAADKTMLLIYPGLLARYGQMEVLTRLSQQVGHADGIPGLWMLIPNEHQAAIDHKPIPLIGPGQKARIPASWLANQHRA